MPVAAPLAVAAVSAAASAYGAHKNAKAQEKSAKSQADLYNQWLAQRNTGAQDILSKLQAGGYDPFSKQVLENGSSTTQRTNPFITENYKPLEGMMRGIMENRLARGSSLPQGYEANAIRNANSAFQGAAAAANNAAARRGLSGQQAFATASPFNSARAGQIADIRANTPLLERQMSNEDIGISKGLTESFGKGSVTKTDTRGWSESLPDINSLTNLLLPAGPQQTTQSPYSGSGSAFSSLGGAGMSLASMLGQMYANRGSAYEQNPLMWQATGNAAAKQGGLGALQWSTPGTVMGPGGYPIATTLGGHP